MTATPTTPPPGTGAPTAATTPADSSPPDSTTVPPAGRVYLVAGGDLVALFDNRDAADIMLVTMVGANLDPVTACLSAARWVEVRAGLLADAPGVTITDTRTGRAGSTR